MKGAQQFVVRKEAGQFVAEERYSADYVTPQLQPSQEVTLIFASEEGGNIAWGVLVPMKACSGGNRYPIEDVSKFMHWALGAEHAFFHHSRRGQFHANLVSGPPTTEDMSSYSSADILMPDVSVVMGAGGNDVKNPYICGIFDLEQLLPAGKDISSKFHVAKFSALVDQDSAQYVHHMILYECEPWGLQNAGYTHLSIVPECESMPPSCNSMKWPWAVGSEPLVLPTNVGMPFGSGSRWYALQMHYYNPSLHTGVRDSSGVRLTFAPALRTFDAAVFRFNGGTDSEMRADIPAGQQEYVLKEAVVPSQCTDSWTADELNVVGVVYHAHLVGKSLNIDVVRADTLVGTMRLEHLYDFNHQSLEPPSVKKIRRGDDLVLRCAYDTSGKSTPTSFGLDPEQSFREVIQGSAGDRYSEAAYQVLSDMGVRFRSQHVGGRYLKGMVDMNSTPADLFSGNQILVLGHKPLDRLGPELQSVGWYENDTNESTAAMIGKKVVVEQVSAHFCISQDTVSGTCVSLGFAPCEQVATAERNPAIPLEELLPDSPSEGSPGLRTRRRIPVLRGLLVDSLSFGTCVRTAAAPLRRTKVLSLFPRYFVKSELEHAIELGFEGSPAEVEIRLEPGECMPVHPPASLDISDRLYFRHDGLTSEPFSFQGLDGVEHCRTFHVYRDRSGDSGQGRVEPRFVQVDIQKTTFPAKNHVPLAEGYFLVLRPRDFRSSEDLLFHFDNQTPYSYFATISGGGTQRSSKLLILEGGMHLWQHLFGYQDADECLKVQVKLIRDNAALREHRPRPSRALVSLSLGDALTSRNSSKPFALEASLRLTAAYLELAPGTAEEPTDLVLAETLAGSSYCMARWHRRLRVQGEFVINCWRTQSFVPHKARVDLILEDLNRQKKSVDPEVFVAAILSVEACEGEQDAEKGKERVTLALGDKWQVCFVSGDRLRSGMLSGSPAWRQQLLEASARNEVIELQTHLELTFSTTEGGAHNFTVKPAPGWSGPAVRDEAEGAKEKASWNLSINVPVLSVSWIHRHEEVLAVRVKGIKLEVGQHATDRSFDIGMQHLQVDHFMDGGELPVVLRCSRKVKYMSRMLNRGLKIQLLSSGCKVCKVLGNGELQELLACGLMYRLLLTTICLSLASRAVAIRSREDGGGDLSKGELTEAIQDGSDILEEASATGSYICCLCRVHHRKSQYFSFSYSSGCSRERGCSFAYTGKCSR
ncbi:moxd1 [Symbiodinium sp. CCMP2592]|nr:moxd1 [Symbiodinium sp. CCMP2592]